MLVLVLVAAGVVAWVLAGGADDTAGDDEEEFVSYGEVAPDAEGGEPLVGLTTTDYVRPLSRSFPPIYDPGVLDCAMTALVEGIGGGEELAAKGVSPEELSDSATGLVALRPDQVQSIAASMRACGMDFLLFLDLILAEGDTTPEQRTCILAGIDPVRLSEVMVRSVFSRSQALAQDVSELFAANVAACR